MATIADFHLHGFDVSHFQPAAPDFTVNGRCFAIMKATEGATDPNFAKNRDAAHAQGATAVGFYHFARPGSDVNAQAARFLNALGERRPGEFAVLDFEKEPWSEGWAVTFLETVRAAGWPIVFYTYNAMLKANPHANIRATGAALWIASYNSTAPATDWPWTFWQHTDGQDTVNGNDGPWDCSVFHTNNLEDLAAFVGTTPGDDMTPAQEKVLNDALTRASEASVRSLRVQAALGIAEDGASHSTVLENLAAKVDKLAEMVANLKN